MRFVALERPPPAGLAEAAAAVAATAAAVAAAAAVTVAAALQPVPETFPGSTFQFAFIGGSL